MHKNLLANTQGQNLEQHTFGVAILAKSIIKSIVPNDSTLINQVFTAAIWHDIENSIRNTFIPFLEKTFPEEKFTFTIKNSEFKIKWIQEN
jgi:HD superfamily phosphohydrolase YqeK